MNKHKTKTSSIMIFIFALVFASTVIPSTASPIETSVSPIGVQRPQGLLQPMLHNAFLWLIGNMQSAGFTPDNVYYGVYNSVGEYTYPISSEREREITLELTGLKNLLNTTIDRLEEDPTTEPDTLEYLNNLYNELLSYEEVTIYHKVNTDLFVTSSHDRKAVTIFYDNDLSVLDMLNKIKNNETITEQPFTGDEILTNVFMSLIRDEIRGSYEVVNTWDYEDGSDATLLKDFINRIINQRWLTQELIYLFRLPAVNIMRTMAQYNNSWNATLLNPRILEYGRFQISQLKIDELVLKKVGNRLVVSEYDYKYLEHHLLGSLVYNDTNGNGIMDIGIKNSTVGQYNIAYPTIGDEAKYRFDIKNIGSRTYQSPQTTDDVLEFGSEFADVIGYLQPIDRNQDDTLFDETAGQAYNVDEISTLFHFSVNNTDASANLKFDYIIGDWNNSESLDGLGFNQLMASTVVDAKMERTFNWRYENNTELNDRYENSSKISRFRLSHVDELFGEIRLDDIPYIWDGTEEVYAVGQLIPMNLIDFTYGRISSEADLVRGISGGVARKTFLYSISYPKWDGKSIAHDPSYTVIGSLAAEENGDEAGIPGFEYATVILAIPMIALIEVYRRKRR